MECDEEHFDIRHREAKECSTFSGYGSNATAQFDMQVPAVLSARYNSFGDWNTAKAAWEAETFQTFLVKRSDCLPREDLISTFKYR